MPNHSKIKLLIAGWRGIHHSFAMVNQHQILAMLRRSDIELFHHDMPLYMAHWNSKDHNPGFSESDFQSIMALADAKEHQVNCVYRICAPMYPPTPKTKKTITFAITELNYSQSSLSAATLKPSDYISGKDLVVTSSRWSRDRLLDFGFAEEKLSVVSCGVDLNTFYPLSADELANQRQALGISPETVVFANVGVPTWNKGIDLLVRSFAVVHQKFPHTKLFLKDARGLYGLPVDTILKEIDNTSPGLLTTQIRSAISVITENLSQAQLRALFGMSDWLVSPYRAEGFNLPVLEAQACGTPVITSSGGATDDFCSTPAVRKIASVFHRGILRDGEESCWVEPNMPALEALMLQAAAEGPRSSYDTMRLLARHNAEQYSWDKVTEGLVDLCKKT